MRQWLHLKLMIPDVPSKVLRQHQAIYAAIRARTAEGARKAMMEHLASTVRLVSQVIEEHTPNR
jgi:DNA-binding FadR family transcriptional regulator